VFFVGTLRNAVCVARLLTFMWAVLCVHLCDDWS